MTVIDLGEARRRREEHAALVTAAAEWVLTTLPHRIPWIDNPDFDARWPGLDRSTLGEIEAAILQRFGGWQAAVTYSPKLTEADIDAAVCELPGRHDHCIRAATWLDLFTDRDQHHPDFVRFFGDLTTAEMILTTAERLRPLVRASRR